MKINKEAFEIALARKAMLKKDIPAKTKGEISISTVNKACKGEHISTKSMGQIALALNVDVTELVQTRER